MTASAGFYLAVTPRYRRACVEIVRQTWPGDLAVWVSDAHLDPSVRTDPDVGWYRRVRMVRVRRAAFLQVGHWRDALRRGTTVVDLNPRSLTAWLLLVLRRASGRRVLVWGHVHPRAGQGARTAPVRRLMRRLAHGTVSYTVADAADARADLPGSPVWVATNALYRRDDIRVPAGDEVGERDHLVFVGRFVRAKKVDLLVRAFAVARQARPGMRLTLVGDGELRPELERFVREQGLQDAVTFAGWVDDVDALRAVHARAFAAVSPGFAGLSLTQAAGFGVPTLVSRDEPHSPEIELADHGAVRWFPTDSVEGLATAALAAWDDRASVPDRALSAWVRESYSAESMARGLVDALGARVERPQEVSVA